MSSTVKAKVDTKDNPTYGVTLDLQSDPISSSPVNEQECMYDKLFHLVLIHVELIRFNKLSNRINYVLSDALKYRTRL